MKRARAANVFLVILVISTYGFADPEPTPTPSSKPMLGFRDPGDVKKAPKLGASATGGKGKSLVISNSNLDELAAKGRLASEGGPTSPVVAPTGQEGRQQALEQEIQDLESQLERLKKGGSDSRGEIAQLERKLLEKRRELARLSRSAEDTEARPGKSKRDVWVARYDAAMDRVRELEDRVKTLGAEVDRLESAAGPGIDDQGGTVRYHTNDMSANHRSVIRDLNRALDSLRRAEVELREARDEVEQVKKQARRDGAEPGWFRGR